MEIGEKIKFYRKAKGMTLRELVNKSGCSYQNIQYFEVKKRNPSIVSIQKIASALGVSVSDLVSDERDKESAELPNKIQRIAYFYGFRPQAQMMIEECSELIKSICKWNRKYDGSFKAESSDCPERTEIIGELADVIIMAKQLAYLLSAEDEVKHMIEFKLDRQLARMEGENVD